MSETVDFLNQVIKPECDDFFDRHSYKFDLTHNEGCGQYTEALIKHLRLSGYIKVGHLKKNPGQTQYNGHANDAFLYREGDPSLYRAVDIIGAAESTDPANPPRKNFGIDEPRYSEKDWMAEPNGEPVPSPDPTVPYKAYEGDAYWHDKVGKVLYWDYTGKTHDNKPTNDTRAGRVGLDSMSIVWTARTIHDIKMEGLDPQTSLDKHRAEWCAGLNIPVVPVPPEVLA